ncbi:5-formyltetrahydrofolate cyclo-ligase [Buchnera aphidicola (Thelaxes suberi)]|uniref:5-formyltetrahydrofolate cyclo-ligase n=1 Tax=Buchnera aphidicola TaxID=9 RepID=UPI00346458C6
MNKIIRKKIKKNIIELKNKKKKIYSLIATNLMLQNILIQKSNNIGLFYSTALEISTLTLINRLFHQNKNIFLPKITSLKNRSMIFLQYNINDKLEINQYHIYEPIFHYNKIINHTNLDVIIVPLVAFNKNGYRLGQGCGFYDRLLQNFNKKNNLIGFAYALQYNNNFIVNNWDIPLGSVITNKKSLYFF